MLTGAMLLTHLAEMNRESTVVESPEPTPAETKPQAYVGKGRWSHAVFVDAAGKVTGTRCGAERRKGKVSRLTVVQVALDVVPGCHRCR